MKRRYFKNVFLMLMVFSMVISMGSYRVRAAENDKQIIFSPMEEITLTKIGEVRENNINQDWKFYEGKSSEAHKADFSDSDWTSVNLPHDFSILKNFDTRGEAESGFLLGGTGWYRKSFVLPERLNEREWILNFDGVYKDAYVYVNGEYVGENHYGYSSFSFDITEHLVCDGVTRNVIAVCVEHELPSSRWYSGSGIYRDVTLISTGKVHVDMNGTEVTTPRIKENVGDVVYTVEIVNSAEKEEEVTVKSSVWRKDGGIMSSVDTSSVTIPANGKKKVEISGLSIQTPDLWSPDSPNLYTVKTEILVNGEVSDCYETDFGFRWFEFDDTKGFSLNGNNMKLNGMCMHHDQGALGSAAYYDAMYRQLKIMKEMGANAIRITHNPGDKKYLEICDKLGLLVIEELFDGWDVPKNKNSKDFSQYFNVAVEEKNKILGGKENGRAKIWAEFVVKEVVRRDRNSPSLILWSLGNEISEGAGMSPTFARIAPNLVRWVGEEDSTRKTTIGDNQKAGDPVIRSVLKSIKDAGGVVGFNYASASQLDSLKNQYGCFISAETSSHIHSRGIYKEYRTNYGSVKYARGADGKYHLTSYDESAVSWGKSASASMYDTLTRDHVAGEFVWTGFDYIGEPTPWWEGERAGAAQYGMPTYPNSSYFGTVETTGFPKDAYYLYRSQWKRDGKTCHLVTAWDAENMSVVGGKTPVVLYSDAKKVELYSGNTKIAEAERVDHTTEAGHKYHTYNTKSQDSHVCTTRTGYRNKGLYGEFFVAFTAGSISAKAYGEDGEEIPTENIVGNYKVNTPSVPARIKLQADRKEIAADGKSLSYVTVNVEDEAGVLDTKGATKINLTLEGNGEIAGVDNGDQATDKKYQNGFVLGKDRKTANISAFSGKALVIVRSLKGKGEITLTATPEKEGMKGETLSINTKPVSEEEENEIVGYKLSRHCYVPLGLVDITLPNTVEVVYKNGTSAPINAVWDAYDKEQFKKSGDYKVTGKAGNIPILVNVHVYAELVAAKNHSDITKPGEMPILPGKVMLYTKEGKAFKEEKVTWDVAEISEENFKVSGQVLEIKGKTSCFGKEFPVKATIRVAEAEFGRTINITDQLSSLTESCVKPSDNLNAIKDGVRFNLSSNTNGRWTNWWERGKAENPVITMTWATGQTVDSVNLYYFTEHNADSQKPTSVQFTSANNDTNFVPIAYDMTDIPDVESENPKEKIVDGHTFTFKNPVPMTALKVTLGHDVGKYIGLSEMEVISKEVVYNKKSMAGLSSLKIAGKAVNLQNGKFEYELAGDKRDHYEVKALDNSAVTVIPVSYNQLHIIAVSEDGKKSVVYKFTLSGMKKPEGEEAGKVEPGKESVKEPEYLPEYEDTQSQKTEIQGKKDSEAKDGEILKDLQTLKEALDKLEEDGDDIFVSSDKETKLSKDMLEKLKDKDVNLNVRVGDYQWKIEGRTITTDELDRQGKTEINLGIRSADEDEKKLIDSLINKTAKIKAVASGENKGIDYIAFEHKGELPFNAEIKHKFGKEYKGKTVFLNTVDEKAKRIKTLSYAVVNEDGEAEFVVPYTENYAVVTLENVNRPSISKTKKVTVGKKYSLKKNMKNVLKGDKITYSSSNKGVVKVDKKGNIIPKKAGKSVITVKYRQGSKVYKMKVTIHVKKK